jgi:hypothetical protein
MLCWLEGEPIPRVIDSIYTYYGLGPYFGYRVWGASLSYTMRAHACPSHLDHTPPLTAEPLFLLSCTQDLRTQSAPPTPAGVVPVHVGGPLLGDKEGNHALTAAAAGLTRAPVEFRVSSGRRPLALSPSLSLARSLALSLALSCALSLSLACSLALSLSV